ncbi:MAG: hypothetical protein KC478_14995 [Bacteriovoracaceae bacterium]|nr:hypothetical protein [Bacteriovoracaceae bacterium]
MLRSIIILGTIISLGGCAKNGQRVSASIDSSCKADSIEASHIELATKAMSSKFSGCFSNYLRLNKLDELSVKVCSHLIIHPVGKVVKARVSSNESKALSNDLKWCLEQELWKMNYSKLQFESSQSVKFPLHFQVRK